MGFTVGKGSQKGFSEGVLRRAFPEGALYPLGEYAPLGVRPNNYKRIKIKTA